MRHVNNGPPVIPTPFARHNGVAELGSFDPQAKTYTLTVVGGEETATNFFGTDHGGWLAGLLDDAAGMLAYYLYGVNSAVTRESKLTFLQGARPGQPITIQVSLVYASPEALIIEGGAHRPQPDASGKLCFYVTMSSTWTRRDQPRARSQ